MKSRLTFGDRDITTHYIFPLATASVFFIAFKIDAINQQLKLQ